MEGAMQVEVVSPSRPVARVKADRVSVPGTLGYMAILPGHAALISELAVGELTIDKVEVGEDLHYFVSGGYIEVENDRVTVLADVIENPSEIDRARAEASKSRALERLTKKEQSIDIQRAQAALRRAETRLKFLDLMVGVVR